MLTNIDQGLLRERNIVNINPLSALLCWDFRVGNTSYNKYTKFSLKIYQADTKFICSKNLRINDVFHTFYTTSLNDHRAAVEQYHRREAASSISTCLTWQIYWPWKIQPSNICNCIFVSFVVHRILMLCKNCFAVCNFLFAQFAEGIGLSSTIASHANFISQSSINLLPRPYAAFQTLNGCIGWLKTHT